MLLLVSCVSVTTDRKEPSSGIQYTETIADKTFKNIKACSIFDVRLHKSDKYSVDIEISEELKDYLIAEVKDGELLLCFDNDYNIVNNKYEGLKARADIYIPSFERISLSGASSFESVDTFNVDNVKFILSGASDMDKAYIIAKNADISASGSSDMDANLYAETLKINASGASDIELSSINGKTSLKSDIHTSGSSDVDMNDFMCENIKVRTSGASTVSVYPLKSLTGQSSGASEIKYINKSRELKTDVSCSGASSIKAK